MKRHPSPLAILIATALLLGACTSPRSSFPGIPPKAPLTTEQLSEAVAAYCGFTGEKSISIATGDDEPFVVNRWETWYFTPLQDSDTTNGYEAALCKIGFSTAITHDPEGPEGDWNIGFSPEAGTTVTILGHYWWVEDPGSDNIFYRGTDADDFLRANGLAWLIENGLAFRTVFKRFGLDRQTGEIIPLP